MRCSINQRFIINANKYMQKIAVKIPKSRMQKEHFKTKTNYKALLQN